MRVGWRGWDVVRTRTTKPVLVARAARAMLYSRFLASIGVLVCR